MLVLDGRVELFFFSRRSHLCVILDITSIQTNKKKLNSMCTIIRHLMEFFRHVTHTHTHTYVGQILNKNNKRSCTADDIQQFFFSLKFFSAVREREWEKEGTEFSILDERLWMPIKHDDEWSSVIETMTWFDAFLQALDAWICVCVCVCMFVLLAIYIFCQRSPWLLASNHLQHTYDSNLFIKQTMPCHSMAKYT